MDYTINSKVKKLNGIKIKVPDSRSGTAYNTTKYHSNTYKENDVTDNFVNVKMETTDGKKTQKRMFQPDPIKTIKADIKKIEKGDIRNTELKNEFVKLMLNKGESYDINVNGSDVEGKYTGFNQLNKKQIRFEVNGERINTDKEKVKIKIEGKEYII